MDIHVRDKVAIVTGGSRGIGLEIARTLRDAGAEVHIVARNAEVVEEAARALGEAVTPHALNVGDADAAAAVVDRVVAASGAVDILVNNAATNPHVGPMMDVERSAWDKTFATNLWAPLMWSQLVWDRSMKSSHGGCSIVNIASVGAFMHSKDLGVYGLTKAALTYLTAQLAGEIGPHVRVNAVAPGLVRTELARALWEGESGKAVADGYPLERLGEVEDVARAVLYLVGDTGSWITGQTLVLDGGGLVAAKDFSVQT